MTDPTHIHGGHNRGGLAGVLLDHYPRGTSDTGVRCECGEDFCCSVSMANHQADEVWKVMHR